MTELPQWFPMKTYHMEMTQTQWAFEIFIRLQTADRKDFIVNNYSFSSSYEENMLHILSKVFPDFIIEDALKVMNLNRSRVAEDNFNRLQNKPREPLKN